MKSNERFAKSRPVVSKVIRAILYTVSLQIIGTLKHENLIVRVFAD